MWAAMNLQEPWPDLVCTEGWSCDGPALLVGLIAVVEFDPLDDFAELSQAA